MTDLLHVATRKGVFAFRRRDGNWEAGPPSFLGAAATAVLQAADGTLYAALRHGHFGVKVHRSEDGGETWAEVASPAIPPDDEPVEKQPALDMIWTLTGGTAAAPDTLWAGTLPGAVFRSDDRGESWHIADGLWSRPERKTWFGGGYDLSGVHSIQFDPRDRQRITIGISSGGIWKSDDGAATWRQAGTGLRAAYMPPEQAFDPAVQDPHRLAICAAAPDVMWCQHHNGIFRSTDGGETFAEIENVPPSVFGFAVAAHPQDPETAWFVPAVKDECRVPVGGRLVVTRTRDGGRSFEAIGEGLPADGSYDLIYRHGLDVDATGRRLAMGSTTGNLWVSEDGGGRWTLASGTLPPIAQVAFA
ncbi:MAG: WD40/YVTN/BNR-like repeat-containing protein [Alphaproteobacteria bacterium]